MQVFGVTVYSDIAYIWTEIKYFNNTFSKYEALA